MDKDVNSIINRLDFKKKANSYPILKKLVYFRDLHFFIEENIKIGIKENASLLERKEDKSIDLETLKALSSINRYKNFQSILRSSLLISLCSFVENLLISATKKYGREYENFSRDLKRENKNISILETGIKYFKSEGILEIENIDGWDYVKRYEFY